MRIAGLVGAAPPRKRVRRNAAASTHDAARPRTHLRRTVIGVTANGVTVAQGPVTGVADTIGVRDGEAIAATGTMIVIGEETIIVAIILKTIRISRSQNNSND
jgi:hypothetical protein